MSRKRKRSKQQQKSTVNPQQKISVPHLIMHQINHARHKMLQGDFADVITTYEPLLSYGTIEVWLAGIPPVLVKLCSISKRPSNF
jgi:hypothetical protein